MGTVVVLDDEVTYAAVGKVCAEVGLNAAHARTLASLLRIEPAPSVVITGVPADRDPRDWVAELRRTLPGVFVAVVSEIRDPRPGDADYVLECPIDESAIASTLQAALARRRAPTAPPEVRKSLLVVEPVPGLAIVMRRWLGGAYNVTVVATGTRAFEEIHTLRFDAVLCELYLPDMDASDFHAAVDHIEPGLAARTLFMSGGLVVDRTRHFLARIPNQWIAKPFDLAQLRAALDKLSA
jgi:CheY-like chemotaxis protein